MITVYKYLELLPKEQNRLFTCNMGNKLFALSEELKGINSSVQHLRHIRASVILNWLKKYPVRQAQYMIGHKWITSTEEFKSQDVDELNDMLKLFHPFG